MLLALSLLSVPHAADAHAADALAADALAADAFAAAPRRGRRASPQYRTSGYEDINIFLY